MKTLLALAAAGLILAACATSTAGQAPACRGPRRPANPFGSVLSDTPVTPGTAAAPATPTPCAGDPR